MTTILVDIQAVVKVIRSAFTKFHCVRLCKETITRLSVENSMKTNWVSSHVRIEGNEKADELARQEQSGTQML